MIPTSVKTKAVDTPDDLKVVEALMQHDELMPLYANR
jgi:hypothetical protein